MFYFNYLVLYFLTTTFRYFQIYFQLRDILLLYRIIILCYQNLIIFFIDKTYSVDDFETTNIFNLIDHLKRASRGWGWYRWVKGFRTSALFRYSLNCALKFLNQFTRNTLRNHFKNERIHQNDVPTAFS